MHYKMIKYNRYDVGLIKEDNTTKNVIKRCSKNETKITVIVLHLIAKFVHAWIIRQAQGSLNLNHLEFLIKLQ